MDPLLKGIRIPISGTITADQSLFKALGRKRERAGKTARVELRPRPPYVLGVPLVCVKIGAPQNVCLCVCDTRLDTTARKIKRTATATPFEELSFSVCVSFHFPFENKPQKGAGGGPSALRPLGPWASRPLSSSSHLPSPGWASAPSGRRPSWLRDGESAVTSSLGRSQQESILSRSAILTWLQRRLLVLFR